MLKMENVFLTINNIKLIESVDVEDKPHLNMTYSVTLPGRTLAIVCICNNLEPNQSGHIYEIKLCSRLHEKYPNLCVIPNDTQCGCT